MTDMKYYEGKKELKELSWSESYGKVHISYSVTEEWERVKARSIGCGEEINLSLKKKNGIKSTHKTELSSMVKGSIGQKGIAQFETQISEKIGIEISHEDYREEEESQPIKAPDCLRKHIIIYQLVHRHVFNIKDKRFFLFNNGEQKVELKEYLDEMWASTPTVSDPECHCEDIKDNDGVINLKIENLGITSGFTNTIKGLYVVALDMELGLDVIEGTEQQVFKISTGSLPPYLSYIAGFNEEAVNIHVQSIDYIAHNIAQQPTVMVVDDSVTMRSSIERQLVRQGLSVFTAFDGEDALTQLDATIPDLLIVDSEMPNMDGYELVRHMRSSKGLLNNIDIIMTSSSVDDGSKVRAIEAGANDFITKPHLLEDLSNYLKKNFIKYEK